MNETAKFLACLDPGATTWTFQTFDDNGVRKDSRLAKVLHGTLDDHATELRRLNERGAGVFVTVNETNGAGRKASDIVRVRAQYVDLDGAPLDPVLRHALTPHVINETSPGRWHVYWRTDDVPLDSFRHIQKALIVRFNSDPSVHDLPRVMRVPGFWHRKGEPFLSKILNINEHAAYSIVDFELDEDCAAVASAQQGTRNTTLNAKAFAQGGRERLAEAARSAGLGEAEIAATLNSAIVAGRTKGAMAPPFSEEALALRFSERHANNLRYVAPWNKWLRFDGKRWNIDETRETFSLARRLCREAAAAINKVGAARATATAKTRAAVVALAGEDRRQAATVAQWDADPWQLNTPGGTIDLRNGTCRDHRAEDYSTKITAVDPDAACGTPLWSTFLATVTDGNTDLQAFLARMCGYALTGSIVEHALFFLYGSGGNGKGVFVSTVMGILGDYQRAAPMTTFVASRWEQHPTDLAGLRGARLVTASETERGQLWAESKIKMMTGGDTISARYMRQDFFEYKPQFKLVISGNHKPGLRSVDEAIRRRLNLVPFTVTIPKAKRDVDLAEKLRAEWPGILAWMINGCLEWQKIGLAPPKIVTDATDDYIDSEDVLGHWIEECCVLDAQAWTSSTEL